MRIMATVPADERALPPGFEALETFVAYWAVAGQNERRHQRCDTTFDEIRRFYDAMLPHADAAMAHLAEFPLRDMPGPEARLMRLVLSLAQASMAVEVQASARVPNAPWPDTVRILTEETL